MTPLGCVLCGGLQLECDRLGSSDCDSEQVNKAAVRTNTFYLGIEVRQLSVPDSHTASVSCRASSLL